MDGNNMQTGTVTLTDNETGKSYELPVLGGTIGPLLFGLIMDRGAPQWVFGASVLFMILTVALALIGDRGFVSRRRRMVSSSEAVS